MTTAQRQQLAELIAREREAYERDHARSRELHADARGSLLSGVPMSWMAMWVGGFPLYLERAHGATIVDVDGNEYADFCLGDTGAMAGHSPEPTMRALAQIEGITTMLPTEDAAWVGAELARRFGLPYWQFALTATDANRWMIRMCRHVTGRPSDRGLQLVLPRLGRRVLRDARRAGPRTRARRAGGPAGGSHGDHAGRGVQRHRLAWSAPSSTATWPAS